MSSATSARSWMIFSAITVAIQKEIDIAQWDMTISLSGRYDGIMVRFHREIMVDGEPKLLTLHRMVTPEDALETARMKYLAQLWSMILLKALEKELGVSPSR